MIYWVIESQEHGVGLFLEKEILLDAAIKDGLRPDTVRAVLSASSEEPILFKAYKGEGEINDLNFEALPDCLYWAWVPVFSKRATNLLLSAGCAAQDFLACEIRGFSKAEFYLHLPEKTYDVLDFLKSKFEINIPTNPPILQRLVQANFSCVLEGMPSIFRVSSLAPNQVLDDLIVDNAFKSSWEANSFTGITFRSV